MEDTPQGVACEVAMRRLDSQLANVDVIENKAGVILGLASTLAAIFAGALALAANDLSSVIVAAPFGLVILVLYLCIMAIGLDVIRTGDWDERPNWDALLEAARDLDAASLQMWVAENCTLSLKENDPQIQRKAKGVNRSIQLVSWYSATIAAALFAVFVVNAACD